MSDIKWNFKFIAIGDSGVGKTNFISKYHKNSFDLNSNSTIGVDLIVKRFEKNGDNGRMVIIDTAGQEKFKSITRSFYRGAHGIILMFDLSNAETFYSLKNWLKDISEYSKDHLSIVLVGNKTDVSPRQVLLKDSIKFAVENKLDYFEISVKNENTTIDSIFQGLIDKCIEKTQTIMIEKPDHIKVYATNVDEKTSCCKT